MAAMILLVLIKKLILASVGTLLYQHHFCISGLDVADLFYLDRECVPGHVDYFLLWTTIILSSVLTEYSGTKVFRVYNYSNYLTSKSAKTTSKLPYCMCSKECKLIARTCRAAAGQVVTSSSCCVLNGCRVGPPVGTTRTTVHGFFIFALSIG
jgi:hypothetical protein